MTRIFNSDYREQCRPERPDPYPVHLLKRVDQPTTKINTDDVQRVDERQGGFHRSGMGEFGPKLQREYKRFVPKHPLSGALVSMSGSLGYLVDAPKPGLDAYGNHAETAGWNFTRPVADQKAPYTNDPIAMARHIKETAYFLRSDVVGICELPPYAVFTHGKETNQPVELNHKYAIGILIDQDWRTTSAFNGHDWISNSMSFLSYSTSGFIACVLADYIRRLGYPARAHHARNYQVVVPPILLMAGLGEMCRIGDVVLNPFLGPRFKAAAPSLPSPFAHHHRHPRLCS